ncbi:biotin--[acetyl-CoA-carboxylase] ligase, partial [Escherichia coli]|uniref:biotin--[acetyl-CoA-carboxylase] ligase n=1 Tax=Escherichia coli TaxID=562 RepID=UPI00359C3CAD
RDAIQHFSQDEVKVKWPNDIYIDNGKVCGFLTEMVANNDGIEAIICGIGINLTQQLEIFDESIRHRATSVQLHDKNKLDNLKIGEAGIIQNSIVQKSPNGKLWKITV